MSTIPLSPSLSLSTTSLPPYLPPSQPLARYCIPVPEKYRLHHAPPSSKNQTAAASSPGRVSTTAPEEANTTTKAATTTVAAADFHASAEFKRAQMKFTSSCYKGCMYTSLFALGMFCLLADNYFYALENGRSHSVTDGWFFRMTYAANYEQWPALKMHDIVIPNEAMAGFERSSSSSWLQEMAGPWVPALVKSLLAGVWSTSAIPTPTPTTSTPTPTTATAGPMTWTTDSPILYHYIIALAHYVYATGLIVFNLDGPKQSDKLEMTTHHVITMFLVGFSWYWKLFRVGAVVLVLHDVSDPFMEVAKLMLYSGKQLWANLWFASFALVFLLSRWVVYPLVILIPST